MSRQEEIKKVFETKFNGKNEYNFNDFCDIMHDYGFLFWDNNTNYKYGMKNIFNKFRLNDDGYVKKNDIITVLPDIIIGLIYNNQNNYISDDDYKSSDVGYVHQINSLVYL